MLSITTDINYRNIKMATLNIIVASCEIHLCSTCKRCAFMHVHAWAQSHIYACVCVQVCLINYFPLSLFLNGSQRQKIARTRN